MQLNYITCIQVVNATFRFSGHLFYKTKGEYSPLVLLD